MWKGPVPLSLPSEVFFAMALQERASFKGRGGSGGWLSKMRESGSAITFHEGLALRNAEAAISGVNAAPSWKLTPRRSRNCQRRLPDDSCHEVARAGRTRPPSSVVTSVSKISSARLRLAKRFGWVQSPELNAERAPRTAA